MRSMNNVFSVHVRIVREFYFPVDNVFRRHEPEINRSLPKGPNSRLNVTLHSTSNNKSYILVNISCKIRLRFAFKIVFFFVIEKCILPLNSDQRYQNSQDWTKDLNNRVLFIDKTWSQIFITSLFFCWKIFNTIYVRYLFFQTK